MVLPCSDRISRVPPYSNPTVLFTCTGLSPIIARLSILFQFLHNWHWPNPRSLATTSGVSVDVLSSRYLDVSVPWVCLKPPMYSEISYSLLITEVRNHTLLSQRIVIGQVPTYRVIRFVHLTTWSRNSVIGSGFPHSEIHGSKLLRSSPRLIAA